VNQITPEYDALLIVSFGGPEKPEDVMPFLENVTRGRGIPRERLLGVAEHYHHFGGRSPINDQNRALIAALEELLAREGPRLPVFWGNRNWSPYLADTVREMRDRGVKRAAAFITSAYGSYSGCRQYLDDIDHARAEVGEGAPAIYRLPVFNLETGFVRPMAANVRAALAEFAAPPHVAFTAHSVPKMMADTSPYVRQIEDTCRAIAAELGHQDWKLVYQSRSGPPGQPWLEPDILQYIRELHAQGRRELVIAPAGFISDHMEVVYDLDFEAAQLCRGLGMKMARAATVGTAPEFVRMIRDSLLGRPRDCARDCCPQPQRVSETAPTR
jgi:protoporphyrin/coproporphyrin ferrochelatase